MDLDTRDRLLEVGAVAVFALGIGFILFTGPTLTTVGVVLVILSAIALIAIVRDFIVKRDTVESG